MNNKELHPRTVSINKKQRLECRHSRQKALSWLIERFPKAFDTSEEIFPLSIGIMSDILSHAEEAKACGISKSKLREALVLFTRRLDYLACLKTHGQRVDLLGKPAGIVTDEEAQCAAMKIKKRIEKSIKNQKKWIQENTPRFDIEEHYYPERPLYAVEKTVKKTEIVFKNKAPRPMEKASVERLKSRLGLSPQE